jgi:hypothetical protein
MKRGNRDKELRREKAEALSAERAKRTPQQQLDLLDKRFGKDNGAKRERAKLLREITSTETKTKKEKKKKRKER